MAEFSKFSQDLLTKFTPENAEGIDYVYEFELIDLENKYYLIVKSGEASMSMESLPSNVTLRASSDVWKQILQGETSPQLAFMSGQLEVDGDVTIALTLPKILGL